MKRDKLKKVGILVLFIIIIFAGLYIKTKKENKKENVVVDNQISYEISNILEYSGNIYYVYNVQNGIVIDYATGESKLAK